jgi:hypothetical protein
MQTTAEQQNALASHGTRVGDPHRIFGDYAHAWLRIIRATPDTNFYAYTKEVVLHDRILEPERPANARWVISLEGVEDRFVDLRRHRVADVFPTEEADAGWHSQPASDLLAVYGPAPVGMSASSASAEMPRRPDLRRVAARGRTRPPQPEHASPPTAYLDRR